MPKTLPNKVQISKIASEISGYFYINVNLKLFFSFFTTIAKTTLKNSLKLRINVSLTNMGENLRILRPAKRGQVRDCVFKRLLNIL